MVLAAWTRVNAAADRTIVKAYGSFMTMRGKLNLSGRKVYLDESGGDHADDTRLRRCGWGLAVMNCREADVDGNYSFDGGFAGSLPGEHQTTLRATLSGMTYLLEVTEGDLHVCPDAKVFVDGYKEGRHLRPWGADADLWGHMGELLRGRGGTVVASKVDAHLTDQQVLRGDVDTED